MIAGSRAVRRLLPLLLVLTAAPASPAAADMTLVSCRAADGTPVSGGAWRPYAEGRGVSRGRASVGRCPTGGPMVAALTGRRSIRGSDVVGLQLRAAPGTTLRRVELDRAVAAAPDLGYRLEALGRFGRRLLEACAGASCARSGVFATDLPAGTTRLLARVGCGRGRCAGGTGVSLTIARAAVQVRDGSPPDARRATGALLSGGLQTGRRRVELLVRDAGTGLAEVGIEVDGRVTETVPVPNAGRCRVPYTSPRPCRRAGTVSLPVDTTRIANGVHALRLRLRDAAGNERVEGPYELRTLNGTTADGSRVDVRLVREGSTAREITLTADAGRRVTVTGTVADPSGTILAGARVAVATQVLEQQGSTPVGETTTDASGTFRLELPPGPSRGIQVAFLGQDGRPRAFGVAVLDVRPPVSLEVRRAGRGAFRWAGTVFTEPRLDRLNVVLEFFNPAAGRWQQAGNGTQTDAFGRFSAAYRFVRRDGRRFRVRARVLPARGVPYASGTSRARTVRAR